MASVREETWRPGDGPGLPVVTLEVDGMRCRIAPQLGFNCLSWEVQTQTGWRELLWTAPDIDINPVATRSGIPILFPFPNRIRDGRFCWEGKAYQLPRNSQGKHAIHGFACYRPWAGVDLIQAQASDPLGKVFPVSAAATFDSRNHEDLQQLWPSNYLCEAKYTLGTMGILKLRFSVENTGDENLPFGLGFHPYYRIPAHQARLALRSMHSELEMEAWELNDLLPTGQFVPLTSAERDYVDGKPLGDHHLDDVYRLEHPEEGPAVCTVMDPSGLTILTLLPSAFSTLVLFTPAHREAVCVEPYSCTTDAINLYQRGVEETGLRVLKPRQSWSTEFEWQTTWVPGLH
jgi:aldose 1-epimerase